MGTVTSSGVAIHYEVEGDGPPIILHTGGAGDLRMWRLAGHRRGLFGRRLILIDHRGRGRSGRPRDTAQHGIDLYVRDVLAVADDAGAPTFSFFGYSAGAAIGYRLPAEHPDRVVSLVGLGAVGPPPPHEGNVLETAARIPGRARRALCSGFARTSPTSPSGSPTRCGARIRAFLDETAAGNG